jgi:hypothetical protein
MRPSVLETAYAYAGAPTARTIGESLAKIAGTPVAAHPAERRAVSPAVLAA